MLRGEGRHLAGAVLLLGLGLAAGLVLGEGLLGDERSAEERPPRGANVTIAGTVDAVETDALGRTQRVAIVSLARQGMLVETPVEDEAAGRDLKGHVGEDVTATGVVKMKADGTASLVVQHFELAGASPAAR